MIKAIALGLVMGIFVSGFSQTLTVVGKVTFEPLELATISGKTPKISVITDANGQADISAFSDADSINIRIVGYESLLTSYAALKKSGFHARLSRSVTMLGEIVISYSNENYGRQTSLHIEPVRIQKATQRGTFNLTDALARIPGVSQLSTGIGISKPVIRGLYGNRILILFSGLRFDNQQWQDEHGLGLSDVGVSKAEVIKGPLSLLYGTGAVGGLINIVEEPAPDAGMIQGDAGAVIHSNTWGGTIQAGTKVNYGLKWFKLHLAATNHADYSDGNGVRVLNSRFNGYILKSSYGFVKNNWRSENHYHFSYDKFGFIFNDVGQFIEPDARWSRKMSGPHHIVLLNILSSVNKLRLTNSVIRLNVGLQSNLRSEDEGAGEISLKMHLLTGQYALKWQRPLKSNLILALANNTSVETNVNYGRRKIVPDARTAESGLSVYLEHRLPEATLEYGLGAGIRFTKTLPTPTVNTDEKDIDPFQKTFPFFSGMAGVSFFPDQKWNLKMNLATGVRTPNLAELSSDGLHEGIYTYEIGDPYMKNEQNINGDIGVYYSGRCVQFSTSGFYNHFNGYIFLDPTDEEWFGFPIFRYRQHDARIYGGEAEISATLLGNGLKISASYSGLVGKLDNGDYLPYMPAQKITPEIRYELNGKNRSYYGFVNSDFVLQQNLVNPRENETPAYRLVNAGIGAQLSRKRTTYALQLAANNLLNEAYYDHLSRLKNFGLLNMGRDISLNLKINFRNKLNKK